VCGASTVRATAGAVLVVQLRCTALACALATGRPTAMHQADPIYVQVHSRSALVRALPGKPTSKGPCYSTLSVASTMLMDRLQWTRKCQDLALQQSLSTQRWFTGWPAKVHQHSACSGARHALLHC
jgi:hypothetical protein